ncbi:MAG: homoserine dehydrogenase [Lachnospiraceae bacterium]|nr:homoserine dehydrogenase [Lachnospiraceae bacterium]
MAKIAVLGYGTVGSGVYEVIKTNQTIVNRNAGEDVEIKYVLDLRDFPGDPVEEILVHDYDVILNDPEVSVVVEVMGGVEPAYTFVKNALLKGKSVCTSNKALVAAKGPELIRIAREKDINFLFEASVGGGIPIIRTLNLCLTADDIEEISGILNGTTNYMLTKMADEGWEFDEALKTAQELGYAERNPEADIDGWDACRKIAILTSLYTGKNTDYEKVYTEGISKVSAKDIRYAKELGLKIKLIAESQKTEAGLVAMVAPIMLKKTHPLYNVENVLNAVYVRGNVLGPAMFFGSGAGKLPTASAVVSDVIAAVNNKSNVKVEWDEEDLNLASIGSVKRSFFVRVSGSEDEKLPRINELFGEVRTVKVPGLDGEFGFITKVMREDDFNVSYDMLDGAIRRIRVDNVEDK